MKKNIKLSLIDGKLLDINLYDFIDMLKVCNIPYQEYGVNNTDNINPIIYKDVITFPNWIDCLYSMFRFNNRELYIVFDDLDFGKPRNYSYKRYFAIDNNYYNNISNYINKYKKLVSFK